MNITESQLWFLCFFAKDRRLETFFRVRPFLGLPRRMTSFCPRLLADALTCLMMVALCTTLVVVLLACNSDATCAAPVNFPLVKSLRASVADEVLTTLGLPLFFFVSTPPVTSYSRIHLLTALTLQLHFRAAPLMLLSSL